MKRGLLCVVRGRDREWEAFCLDFDLAVQGRSFEEAMSLLREAIHSYIETAMEEPEPVRRQLLTRSVPIRTMLMWRFRVALSALFLSRKNDDGSSTFGFAVSCPA
jgi:predicted RNase H-like HicB family nuclease